MPRHALPSQATRHAGTPELACAPASLARPPCCSHEGDGVPPHPGPPSITAQIHPNFSPALDWHHSKPSQAALLPHLSGKGSSPTQGPPATSAPKSVSKLLNQVPKRGSSHILSCQAL